jgi:hypothetical protein
MALDDVLERFTERIGLRVEAFFGGKKFVWGFIRKIKVPGSQKVRYHESGRILYTATLNDELDRFTEYIAEFFGDKYIIRDDLYNNYWDHEFFKK